MSNPIYIKDNDLLLGLIIPAEHRVEDNIEFYTLPNNQLQLGQMNRKAGYQVYPHVHNPVAREATISPSQEVLFIREGLVRITFYNSKEEEIRKETVGVGDVVFLIAGGHSLHFLTRADVIEVKQGPYLGRTLDKTIYDWTLQTR